MPHSVTRLCYRLHSLGRTLPLAITAHRSSDGEPLSDNQLKSLISKAHDVDVAIVRELRSGTVFGSPGDTKIARILPLLAQRKAVIGEKVLVIDEDEPLIPRIRLETTTTGGLALHLGFTDEDDDWYDVLDGRLLAGAQAYFLREHYALLIDANAPWELRKWINRPVIELDRELSPASRDLLVHELAEIGVPEEDLEVLAVKRDPPDNFIATIHIPPTMDMMNPTVSIILEADYDGERVILESARPASLYMVPEGARGGLIERDILAEDQAKKVLRQIGFKYDRTAGRFVARNESALEALDPKAALFPPSWTIITSDVAPVFRKELSLHTDVTFLQDRGLLDLNIGFETLDDNDKTVAVLLEMKELLSWLQSGKRYLQLEDGSLVAPSDDFRRNVKTLQDLGAESHRALVSPLCIGLLQLLGDHGALRIADAATKAWMEELSGTGKPPEVEPPHGLGEILRDYQRHGLDWLAMLNRHRLTGILADDMGLGKTLQTISLLSFVREKDGHKPSLVVAPTSVVGVWRDEVNRFAPHFKVGMWHGTPKERQAIDPNAVDLLITSYGVLRRDAEVLKKINFRYVILDEAQAAKNAASQNAQAVRALVSENRLALTGTPIENRAEELWSAFDFLAPGFLGSASQFRKRYARPIEQGDADAMALLRARVRPLILRRLKRDVAKELPPKIESTMRCDMDTPQRALYDHIAGRLKNEVLEKISERGVERVQLDIFAALTRLRQICCDPAILPKEAAGDIATPASAKLEMFRELMREAVLESDRTVIVFSQFVEMQKRLRKVLDDLGIESLWLHGGTRKREDVISAFQDPEGPRVIVVSLRAGGTGVTLTRADTVIHYDPWWNPAVERQATDRAHRIGQTKQVYVYRLICRDTIEEKVIALAAKKDRLAEGLLSSDGGGASKLITRHDILNLLS